MSLKYKLYLLVIFCSSFFSKRSLLDSSSKVAVSLTSHSLRVRNVWRVIESIGLGRSRPAKVYLWLSNDDFHACPKDPRLSNLVKRGLEIRSVTDLGPHTKYWYALDECIRADYHLVTIDDDVIYSPFWLKNLNARAMDTSWSSICAYRAREIMVAENKSLKPYREWAFATKTTSRERMFFTGVSGVFYPKSFVRSLASYGKAFMDCCPKADDIWLNYVALKESASVCLVFDYSVGFGATEDSKVESLWSSNEEDGNDLQIRSTYDQKLMGLILGN